MLEKTFQIELVFMYRELISFLVENKKKVFLLYGEVGTGKTTFVREFLKRYYKVSEVELKLQGVSSPTFSLINHYQFGSDIVFHGDFYRISPGEMELEEVFEQMEASRFSFAEWPENLQGLGSAFLDVCTLKFKKEKSGRRVDVFFN